MEKKEEKFVVKKIEATKSEEEKASGVYKPHMITDPSYNCSACLGEGLYKGFDPHRLCPVCRGTGKLKQS